MKQDEIHAVLLKEQFNDELLNTCNDLLREGNVSEGMQALREGMQKRIRESSLREWDEFVRFSRIHPLNALIMEDPITSQAYNKPKGYAGDPQLMDLIYGQDGQCSPPEGTSEIGELISQSVFNLAVCSGFRGRMRLVAEAIDDLAWTLEQPKILSIASGHLREADLSGALKQGRVGLWVAFDSDSECLAEVAASYLVYGVDSVGGTIRQLLEGKASLGEFDFVYSTSLFDYVTQPIGQRIIRNMFEMLRPNGRLLVANFLRDLPDVGYMEGFMDWQLVLRDRAEMLDLASMIDGTHIRDIRLLTENLENVVLLEITRK